MTGNGRRRLDSWKDIAQYLGRDLSTVRRWEKEKGLPVHRVPGGSRHAVFAYAEEVDGWLAGVGAEAEATASRRPAPVKRRLLLAGGTLILLLIPAALAYLSSQNSGNPSQASFSGDKLIAWDESGNILWSFAFPGPLRQLAPGEAERIAQVADLDGDGVQEVLVIAPISQEDRATLYCLSSSGVVRWVYKPSVSLRFGGRPYESPWQFTDLLVAGEGKSKNVWAAVAHHTWWPSYVVRIDAEGGDTIAFVSSGWITDLEFMKNGTGSYILAGGVNNEYDAGSLAVLRTEDAPSSSPQTPGSSFACDACPRAQPHRYFVFTRSELSLVLRSPYNIVHFVRNLGHKVEIRTSEAADASGESHGVFEFGEDLQVHSVAMTDMYWAMHNRLESEGKLKHSVNACPERKNGRAVLVWNAQERAASLVPISERNGQRPR